jgi:hypothetical protein
MSDKYIFVVDTDQYAGNFEREMCACLTGQIGDCEVGSEESVKFRKEVGEDMYESMDEWVEQRPDEHGVHRPCKIYPTPGYFNNGLGGEFKDGQEDEALKHYRDYCKNQNDDFYKDMIDEPLSKHPSYQSVAICFYKKPSQKIIDMMKQRVNEFVKGNSRFNEPRTMKISGFRIIKETMVSEETQV